MKEDHPSYPLEFDAHAEGQSAQVITQDNSTNKPMPWLVICALLAGMGFAFGLVGWVTSRDEKIERLQDRGELLALINASENRIIADNQKKQTSFALLDNDYRKVLLQLELQEKQHAKR